MKEILIRLLVAAFLTLAAFALSSSARGQQAGPDSNPAHFSITPAQARVPATLPEAQNGTPAATSTSRDDQTQEALVFSGQIAQGKAALVLMDPVSKMNYQLDDQARARRFVGRQVRVIGKLDMKSNTIHIETINPR